MSFFFLPLLYTYNNIGIFNMSGKYTTYTDNFNVIILFHLLMQTFNDALLKNFPLGNVRNDLFFMVCLLILKEM